MAEETAADMLAQKAERDDAERAHVADRLPTPEEEALAEKSRAEFESDEEAVAEHFEEMTDLGAHVKGEGEIA
jgi:type VI protein secretion system component VasK